METKAQNALSLALAKSDGGVPWPHVRLMVRGAGGVGKSSTIKALAGKEFDASEESTVGAAMENFELCNESFSLAGGGSALKAYDGSQGEFVAALAAHAAGIEKAKADETKARMQSILDDLKKDPDESRARQTQGPGFSLQDASQPRRAPAASRQETPEAKERPTNAETRTQKDPILAAVEDEAKKQPEKKQQGLTLQP